MRNKLLYAIIFLVGSAIGFAQVNTGKITGFVSDVSGAIVTGAPVKATNDATGVVSATESSDRGDYLLNFLIPGTYHVSVEKAGFQTSMRSQVIVQAGGITRIDFSMQVGSSEQTITVEANPISLATETSELSQTFSPVEMQKLPNLDRNPLYQMNLLPGASNGAGSGSYGNNSGENGSAIGMSRPQMASLGGVDANATTVYIEGVPNREPQNAYVGVVPPIEAVQELQVYTGKYNAEFGFSGSAVINVITKSGGDKLHGAAFEFLRNEAPDALNYFNGGVAKTPFRRNQYGGALSGPILRNRLFLFGDYQGENVYTNSTSFTTAPTAKMLTGDFSELYVPGSVDDAGNTYGQIYDPSTRQFDAQGNVISATPFPNNVIPPGRWDAAAKVMNAEDVFGKANLTGISNNLQYLASNRQTVHQGDGRVDFDRSSRDKIFFRYSVLNATLVNSTNVNQFFQGWNANSSSFNQNMEASDLFSFSSTKMNELRLGFSRSNVKTSYEANDKDWNNTFGIPNGNLSGSPATTGLADFVMAGAPSIGVPAWVGYVISNTIGFTDNFTWIKGRHQIKVGTNINHVADVSADGVGSDDPRGTLEFDESMTSYDGIGYNGGGDASKALPVRSYGYPSFLLGNMTESARTMFTAGAPYQSLWQNAWYAQDDFKVRPSLTLNLGLRYELTTRPVARGNREANWDIRTNKLVLATSSNRSPAINIDGENWGPRVGFAWSPYNGKTSIRGGFGTSYWMAYWGGPLTVLGCTYPYYASTINVTPNSLTPSMQLSKNGLPLASAKYDASGNLMIPDTALIRGVAYNWKSQRVDQVTLNIERELRSNMILDIGYLHVRGIHDLHTDNINQAPPTHTGIDYQTQRPLYSLYPQLGDVPIAESNAGTWYDALTARFTANLGKSSYINASYAHGRNFANGNDLDQTNVNQFYGPTQQDIPHIFNAQLTTELPVGRGRKFLGKSNHIVDALVGGWEYSALLHISSGVRFDVYDGDSTSLNNGQTNRPDRIGSGKLSHPNVDKWFDSSAFIVHTTAMTYGNAGINPLFADGEQQLDSSVSKDFHLMEGHQIEFRVDIFNTFNHPNFGQPDSNIGDDSVGEVTSTAVDNRRMQFSLRYSF